MTVFELSALCVRSSSEALAIGPCSSTRVGVLTDGVSGSLSVDECSLVDLSEYQQT